MRPERMRPPEGGPGSGLAGSNSGINHTTPLADVLLPRLHKVRETAPGQWIACCPAHEDRSPSLSVKQVDDRILVHCFSGCEAGSVLAAVGLELKDLFDRPLSHHKPRLSERQRRRHDHAAEALKSLTHECRIVWVCAEQMHSGFNLDPSDRERLNLAMSRIKAAGEVCS